MKFFYLSFIFIALTISCSNQNVSKKIEQLVEESFIDDTLFINIQRLAYDSIQSYRDSASHQEFIKSKYKIYFECDIIFQKEDIKAKIKLKGDWVDHVSDSLRFSVKIKQKTSRNLPVKFAIQRDEVRNGPYEIIYLSLLKLNGITTVPYYYMPVKWRLYDQNRMVEQIDVGYMVLEGDWTLNDKNIVYKPIEGDFFKELTNGMQLPDDIESDYISNIDYKVSNCKTSDDIKRELRKSLNGKLGGVEFDKTIVNKFVTISNLCGANHNLRWHNLSLILKNGLFEPIGNDGNAGRYFSNLKLFPYFPFIKDTNEVLNLSLGNFGDQIQEQSLFISKELNASFEKRGIDKGWNTFFVKRNRNLITQEYTKH